LPRTRANSRTKDLVDLVLLIEKGEMAAERVAPSVSATFATRGTHEVPLTLPAPPPGWEADYARMAAEADLTARDLEAGFTAVSGFWGRHGAGP
ncbi:MAG: nucleotidyl transferase AbiEii/AbiGii toxin family protein, partial [Gemmataceae bacterium]